MHNGALIVVEENIKSTITMFMMDILMILNLKQV